MPSPNFSGSLAVRRDEVIAQHLPLGRRSSTATRPWQNTPYPSRGVNDALIAGRAAQLAGLGRVRGGGEVPVAVQEVAVDGRDPGFAARGDGGDVEHRRARQLGDQPLGRQPPLGLHDRRQVLRRPFEAPVEQAAAASVSSSAVSHMRPRSHRPPTTATRRCLAPLRSVRRAADDQVDALLGSLARGVGLLRRHPAPRAQSSASPRRPARCARCEPQLARRVAPRSSASHGAATSARVDETPSTITDRPGGDVEPLAADVRGASPRPGSGPARPAEQRQQQLRAERGPSPTPGRPVPAKSSTCTTTAAGRAPAIASPSVDLPAPPNPSMPIRQRPSRARRHQPDDLVDRLGLADPPRRHLRPARSRTAAGRRPRRTAASSRGGP